MAYKVNIDIGGSCLFVARPSSDAGAPDRMHVLMPAKHPGPHGDHRHIPVLSFDAAFQQGSTLDLNTGQEVYVLLREIEVLFGGSGATLKICPDIADLTQAGSKLADGVLGNDDKELLTSRVTLEAGRSYGVFPGACWKWKGDVRRLAHIVRWQIDVPADPPFYVELRELRTGTEMYKIPLQPELGKGDVIKLNIYHVPPEDLPLEKTVEDTPADDSPAPHFAAYYGLFTPPLSLPVPLFRTVDACTPYGGTGCTKLQDAGGSPFTCMVGGVTL